MFAVLGDLVEDVVVWVDGKVRYGTDSDVRIFRRRGGSAANVASFAARLWPTRFVGCVGADVVGDRLVADLAADGVDVKVARHGETGTIVVLVDDRERTILPDRGAARLLDDVPADWLAGVDHLHVPAYSFDGGKLADTAVAAIETVRRNGGTTSVDASSTGMVESYGVERMLALLERLAPDFLLANRDESEFLGLLGGQRRRFPATTVVTKAGAQATTVDVPGRDNVLVDVPTVAEVRDVTGAGDAFAAGFLTAFLRTGDVLAAVDQGHATAAKTLAAPGASHGDR